MKRFVITITVSFLLFVISCQKDIPEIEGEPKIVFTERVSSNSPNEYPSGTDIVAHYNDGSMLFFAANDSLHECECVGNKYTFSTHENTTVIIPDSIIANVQWNEWYNYYDYDHYHYFSTFFFVTGIRGQFEPQITTLSLPSSIQNVSEDAFKRCSLETVTILHNSKPIGTRAFNGAFNTPSACSLILSEGLNTVGMEAFKDCSSFTNITIPSTMQFIGDNAFSNCSSLSKCTCYAINPPFILFGEAAPFVNSPIQAIYVPEESVEEYRASFSWSQYADIIYPIE